MTDHQRCPLCQRSNQCSLAAGREDLPCWCFEVQVSPDALAQLSEAQRNRACLCPDCASAARPAGTEPAK
ncbi:cysteine-rich CWC family protein [Pseudomonas sp. NCCP-436]|uniref:cysteine-rich CWC family protein n=1 Tax=Pseudomonas sp. NCCP-436 TaxID=2842481 RepID=UPI001C80E442|nr:cysteine-rich CWC family protein [Pseudomonas sp. NCCP-436]